MRSCHVDRLGRPDPLDRLTASDRFLMWDDYGWSSDIGALVMLDAAPLLDRDGRVRLDAVRQHVASRLHLVPRFRQVLYRPKRGLGWPLWVDAPSFDVANHIRVRSLDGAADEHELMTVCEELMQRPFERSLPLWELWLLPGLPEGQLAAVLKLHHVLADGTAALAAFGALLDDRPDTPQAPATPWHPRPIPTSSELFRDNVRRRRRELGRTFSGLAHSGRTFRQAREALPAWREVLTDKPAPKTSLNNPVGTRRDVAVVRDSVDAAKRAAKNHNAKVSDVVLASVAGGLRELLAGRGELVDGLTQRAMVTISQHDEEPGKAQGNKPGWMMVPLPVGEPDPRRRLDLIAAESAARKHRARPEAGSGIFRFMAAQRLWYRLFPRQRAVNMVVSNVPGPPFAVYLAGARVRDLIPLMPTMGNLTLVVATLSYEDRLNIAATGDHERCPDLEVFAHGVRTSLDALDTLDTIDTLDSLDTADTRQVVPAVAATAESAFDPLVLAGDLDEICRIYANFFAEIDTTHWDEPINRRTREWTLHETLAHLCALNGAGLDCITNTLRDQPYTFEGLDTRYDLNTYNRCGIDDRSALPFEALCAEFLRIHRAAAHTARSLRPDDAQRVMQMPIYNRPVQVVEALAIITMHAGLIHTAQLAEPAGVLPLWTQLSADLRHRQIARVMRAFSLLYRLDIGGPLRATYAFRVDGPGGGLWRVDVSPEAASAREGAATAPSVTVGFRATDDFCQMLTARLNPAIALLTRRLRVRGDLRLFFRMNKLFSVDAHP